MVLSALPLAAKLYAVFGFISSVSAGQHQIYLCDSGGWSRTPYYSNVAGQVLLPWRCDKLVHTHQLA